MSISNTGSVDLESVLNVRRRTLASIVEGALPPQQPHYSDTIYLKREDNSDSILSINSQIFIFGELQLLYSIFERYTSNINLYEDSVEPNSGSPLSSQKPSFSATLEEDEHDEEGLPIVSTLRQTSISSPKGSPSSPQAPGSPLQTPGNPLQAPGSPPRKKPLSSIGRSQTVGSTVNEYSFQNLEGKRYGCIELPNMAMIEILEILLRTGLELVNVSSDYDKQNVLHQNFIFSKICQTQKYGPPQPRSSSFVGT
jgi:hypothetical protein